MDRLINKQYKTYNKISRYANFPYYFDTSDNKYLYGITRWLREDTKYSIHTVEYGDTIDSLALYYYQNPTYFWIICDFNRIADPYTKLTVGQKIKIPVFSDIEYQN